MKISLNWTKEHADIKVSTDELVELIGKRLGAIEDVIDIGKRYEGIVAAKVVSCQPHPDADKLQVCLIDDGGVTTNAKRNSDGLVEIVCGAPNIRQGMMAAWIPPGHVLPETYDKEPLVIEARQIRGVTSQGMLGSPRELGISQDHGGIMELDVDAKPGDSFASIYQLDDTIIELENKMFTHRPDCFGILGVARELSGIQHLPFKSPEWYLDGKFKDQNSKIKENSNFKSQLPLDVDNEIPDLVPRFMAVSIDDVEVKPSPYQIQSYLSRVGIRPVNNIVDITNYIMHLTAQPMHAYDYDKVVARSANKEARITVRAAKKGEVISILGGKLITFEGGEMIVAADDGPIGVGGSIGGADTEVDTSTTKIILEAATWDMYSIRRTAMHHGIFTDAVTRFSKGQSPLQNDRAVTHALDMISSLASGHVASETHDLRSQKHGPQSTSRGVKVTTGFINDRLGSELSASDIKNLLENVEFSVDIAVPRSSKAKGQASKLVVHAPFWRTDIEIEEDIVEEVGRLHGFDQLPLELPKRDLRSARPDHLLRLKATIRQQLARAGANEILTYSFVHGDLLKKSGQDPKDSYQLANALSPDLQYYRQTLSPSLLDKIHSNIKSAHDEFALFEIGKTHNKIHGLDDEKVPGELNMIALVYASKNSREGSAYFYARKYLDFLATRLGLQLVYATIDKPHDYPVTAVFDQNRSALVTTTEGVFLGIIGEYRADVMASFKLPSYCSGFEIGTDHLLEAVAKASGSNYTPLSPYPKVEQDMTLSVPDSMAYGDLRAALEAALEKALSADMTLLSMKPTSIFQQSGKSKNITHRFQIASFERTLTDTEVNDLLDQAAAHLPESLSTKRI